MKRSETIELRIVPIDPDTRTDVEAALEPMTKAALQSVNKEQMLSDGDIDISVRRTTPADPATVALITLATQMAAETFKQVVLPYLRQRFQVKEEERQQEARERKGE